MKKYIVISLIALCLIGFFQAGIFRSLLMFVLVGAIPGTALSLSADTMVIIVSAICALGVITAIGTLIPKLAGLYRRYILRKKLLTIPAFRRQVRNRLA